MSVIQSKSIVSQEVFNGHAPTTNSRAIKMPIDFSVFNPYAFDLVAAQENSLIEFVQGVYCDNSLNPSSVSLAVVGTNQVLTWPGFSQGYLPVLCVNPPKFVASTTGNTLTITFHFLNFPVAAIIWPASANVNITFGGSTGTDFSANKPVALANLVATVPVNANRNSIEVQNQAAGTIQVWLDDGAGGNISIMLLAPGTGANTQGADWASQTFKGRVRVFATNTTDQVFVHQD